MTNKLILWRERPATLSWGPWDDPDYPGGIPGDSNPNLPDDFNQLPGYVNPSPSEQEDFDTESYCAGLIKDLIRESPSDPYASIQISSDRTFPEEWKRYTFLPSGMIAQRMGNHDFNYRIAWTGLHVSSETGANGIELSGLYIHHDFFDPTLGTEAAILHGLFEVRRLNNGEIASRRSDGNVAQNRECVSQYLGGK